jgi:hypothetical protein
MNILTSKGPTIDPRGSLERLPKMTRLVSIAYKRMPISKVTAKLAFLTTDPMRKMRIK